MSNQTALIPILDPQDSLSRYLEQIKQFPMLEADEEYMLARTFKEEDNVEAAHKLVTSHLRLVAKIAMGYRGYGLPVADLIAEGNLGMMHAVKRFDPERGFRLATYALWWIKASIQEYVLRSWSLVKIGTTAAQKKLFFNLRRLKNKLGAIDNGELNPSDVRQISNELDVSEGEIVSMNQRMSGRDRSLNAPMKSAFAESGDHGEWQDWLEDDNPNQEIQFAENQDYVARHELMAEAMQNLSTREIDIIEARRLKEPPATLDELAQKYDLSRERIRQIERRAFEKLSQNVIEKAQGLKLLPE